ncbi:ArnT family glycosyltransferase [Desulfomarina sp.]
MENTGKRSLTPYFIAALVTYFVLHIVLRVLVSDSLDYDEAEQALLGQWLLSGYTEQPPLYTWIQYGLFHLLGKNVLAVSLLKNSLLFLTYLFVFLSGKKLLNNERAAIMASCSLILIPQIGWESQRDMTHTTLVVCAAAAVLWTVLRLLENRSFFNALLLGFFWGIGILAKANFFLFLLILGLTLLTFRRGRKVLFSRQFLLSVFIALCLSSLYLYWMYTHQEIVFSATGKFKQAVEMYQVKGVTSFFINTFLFLTPLWFIYLLFFPTGYLGKPAPGQEFSARFMLRYGLFFVLVLLVVVLLFKVSYVKDRWMQPLLFAAPLVFFSRFDVNTVTEKQFKRFIGVTILSAVAVYCAFTLRVVGAPMTHHYCRLNYPFTQLANEIRKDGFDGGLIISNNRFIAGNMHFQFPDSQAVIPGYAFEMLINSSPFSQAAVIWKINDAAPHIPMQLVEYLQKKFDINSIDYPVIVHKAPYKYSTRDKVRIGVLLFRLQK